MGFADILKNYLEGDYLSIVDEFYYQFLQSM